MANLGYEHKVKASPILIALFSFCFAVAIGAVWEIFEFAADSFFGYNLQKTGLVDTMWDLIVDSGGALLVSIAGFFYVKYGRTPYFEILVERFVRKNPELFRKSLKK